jgi:hypothetical protein
MLRFRELESSVLYAGLGVELIDGYSGVAPLGWVRVELDVDEGSGVFRPIAAPQAVTAGGITWFPWLERHRDARGRAPRTYRVRVAAQFYVAEYSYDRLGLEFLVAPYDDTTPPLVPPQPLRVRLLPSTNYPFAAAVPVLRGKIVDPANEPVPLARVRWLDLALPTDRVLSDADGEFDLPMRRAPLGTAVVVAADHSSGTNGSVSVQLPQDLSVYQTIQIT